MQTTHSRLLVLALTLGVASAAADDAPRWSVGGGVSTLSLGGLSGLGGLGGLGRVGSLGLGPLVGPVVDYRAGERVGLMFSAHATFANTDDASAVAAGGTFGVRYVTNPRSRVELAPMVVTGVTWSRSTAGDDETDSLSMHGGFGGAADLKLLDNLILRLAVVLLDVQYAQADGAGDSVSGGLTFQPSTNLRVAF